TAGLYKEMVQQFPDEPAYRADLVATLLALADFQRKLQNHERAAQAVADLKALTPPAPEKYQAAAAILARRMTRAERDRGLSGLQQKLQARQYGERAVTLLKEAGPEFLDRKALKESPDFAPLRDRKEFADALGDLLK